MIVHIHIFAAFSVSSLLDMPHCTHKQDILGDYTILLIVHERVEIIKLKRIIVFSSLFFPNHSAQLINIDDKPLYMHADKLATWLEFWHRGSKFFLALTHTCSTDFLHICTHGGFTDGRKP